MKRVLPSQQSFYVVLNMLFQVVFVHLCNDKSHGGCIMRILGLVDFPQMFLDLFRVETECNCLCLRVDGLPVGYFQDVVACAQQEDWSQQWPIKAIVAKQSKNIGLFLLQWDGM